MNQFFVAGVALIFSLTLWGFGRRPKNLLLTTSLENLPLTPASLVERSLETQSSQQGLNTAKFIVTLPKTAKDRFCFNQYLKKLISLGPDERLLAIEMASQWSDPLVLPLLRMGLRDMDSRVVVKAAEAISRFKSFYMVSKTKKNKHYPSNVFLMR